MEILKKTNDKLQRCYNILISKEELDSAITSRLQTMAGKIDLNGFRKGKVPVDIVKRMYGDTLKTESKEFIINEAAKKILSDEKLSASIDHSVDIVKDENDEVEFTLKFEVMPVFELKEFTNIEVEKYAAEITEKEINEALKEIKTTVGESNNHENIENAKKLASAKYNYISNDLMRRSILEKMLDAYDFDVPQGMTDKENEIVLSQMGEEAKRLGKEFTPSINEECRKIAERRVRLSFIFSKIAKENKISVSQEEIAQRINGFSEICKGQYKSAFKKYMRNGNTTMAIASQILEEKVVDYLLSKVKVNEKKCSPADIVALDEEKFDFFKDSVTTKKTKNKRKQTEE